MSRDTQELTLPLKADPVQDVDRLREIYDLDLTSPEIDEVLQRVVAEATDSLGLPVGLVTVVMDTAQYFVAMEGAGGWLKDSRGTPNEWSFCTNIVRSGEAFVVGDATQHPKVRDNPLVHHDNIRCYAGVPLRTINGHIIGSLCVIGVETREFKDEEIEALHGWAKVAMDRIEERRGRNEN